MTLRMGFLALVVFVANAVIMSVEMLATRLLFPQFGNTIFTWSSVICIIIAGLFLGYLLGGAVAQRTKNKKFLIFIELLAAGGLVMFVPGLRDIVLAKKISGVYPPLGGCFVVFGIPAALLASVPPAAVGILTEAGIGASLASGMISGLSAFGSIVGTLATTFYLIPEYGVRGIFIGFGVALGLLALCVRFLGHKPTVLKTAMALILYVAAMPWASYCSLHALHTTMPDPVYSKDSQYQLVRVFEQGTGNSLMRVLMLDSTEEGAMAINTQEAVFKYTRAYKLFLNALKDVVMPHVLFIGGGAYTMPLKVAEGLPDSKVEVAEIDPVVRDVAAKYFYGGSVSNLSTLLFDGRQVLRGRGKVYDAIFVDAYQGVMAIPFHLTTKEFFSAVDQSLKSGGFVSLNVIGDVLEREGFFCSTVQTLAAVFPSVRIYPVSGVIRGTQNIIIVASKRKNGVAGGDSAMAGTGFEKGIDQGSLLCSSGQLLTDDHAPTEWLVARYLK